MIKFIRKNHYHDFNYKIALIISPIIFIIGIITIFKVPSSESYTDYGTIVSIYENPYKIKTDTLTHIMVVAFPNGDNDTYKGEEVMKINDSTSTMSFVMPSGESKILIHNPKKEARGQKILIPKEKSINILVLVLALIGGVVGGFIFFSVAVGELIVFLIKSYKIEIISKSVYKARKELDPFGEEDWSN